MSEANGNGGGPTYTNSELARHTTDALQLFLNEAGRHELLSAEEEVELAQRVERGDLEAKERLVTQNLRLVVANARRYEGIGDLGLLDLIQEGVLGLIRAAEKFDWRKGFRFSTYATLWIRQAIQRGVESRGRTIRIPAHMAQRERKIAAADRRLSAELNRQPTPEEIAKATELPVAEVHELLDVARAVTSLDRPVGAEDGSPLGELLPAEGASVEEEVEMELTEEVVREAVEQLPQRERDVIKMRYGLDGDPEPLPAREAGRRLGISHTAVRELEQRALEHLSLRRELAALGETG